MLTDINLTLLRNKLMLRNMMYKVFKMCTKDALNLCRSTCTTRCIAVVLALAAMLFSNNCCMMLFNNLLHMPSNFCYIIECVMLGLRAVRGCGERVREGSCMCRADAIIAGGSGTSGGSEGCGNKGGSSSIGGSKGGAAPRADRLSRQADSRRSPK